MSGNLDGLFAAVRLCGAFLALRSYSHVLALTLETTHTHHTHALLLLSPVRGNRNIQSVCTGHQRIKEHVWRELSASSHFPTNAIFLQLKQQCLNSFFGHISPRCPTERMSSWHDAEDLVSKYLPGSGAVTMQHAPNRTWNQGAFSY